MFDERDLASCIQCGLCLPSCPTYSVTRLEQHNPRGRIAAMRLRASGEISPDDPAYREAVDTCVQCRACESACPSGVRFGRLIEDANQDQAAHGRLRARRWLARLMARPAVLRLLSLPLAAAQALRLDRCLPARLRVRRRVTIREVLRRLPAANEPDADLFRGCVSNAWFRPVHAATVRLGALVGLRLDTRGPAVCCGALHLHAGDREGAVRQAVRVLRRYPGQRPVIVNSAGCGAMLKEYGALLGTPQAAAFSARVRDVTEIVPPERLRQGHPLPRRIALQLPCHLANVQRLSDNLQQLLRQIPGLDVAVLDDRCCGAGGAYSAAHPEFSDPLRQEKVRQARELGVSVLVSANPGCAMHLDGEAWLVLHPAELLAECLAGQPSGTSAATPTGGV